MLKVFSFDIIVGVIVLTGLVSSIFKNQKKQLNNFICGVLALAATVGTVIVLYSFNYGVMLKNIGSTLLGTGVFKTIESFLTTYYGVTLVDAKLFVVLVLILIAAFALFLVFRCIGLLFDLHERKLYAKYDSYATKHKPVFSIILGILSTAIIAAIIILFVQYSLPVTKMDLSNSLIFKLYNQFDPCTVMLRNIANVFFGL